MFLQLSLSVVDFYGKDAVTILQNLTTNNIKSLAPHQGCETFITEVRGKSLGHGCVFRQDESLRFIGAPGQSERIAAHVDRYTIREDASAIVRDNEVRCLWVSDAGSLERETDPQPLLECQWNTETTVGSFQTPWIRTRSNLWIAPISEFEILLNRLPISLELSISLTRFHQMRTLGGFPWFGIDFDESHLPQEADRDAHAISFNKGCYLGQETIARLDALGQVQKKLARWSLSGRVPIVGETLLDSAKPVARITSVTPTGADTFQAIAMTRRSHFEPGSTAALDCLVGQVL